jgi:TPR repeat protein
MVATATRISDFLEWLRDGDSGFDADDRRYIAAYDLIEALACRGEWPVESKDWRTLLAPVLCSSPAQQKQLYDLVDQWFLGSEAPLKPDGTVKAAQPKRPIPREAWLYGTLCVAVAITLLIAIVHYWPHRHRLAPALVPRAATTVTTVDLPQQSPKVIVQSLTGQPLEGAAVRFGGVSEQTNATGEAILRTPGTAQSKFLIVTKPGYRPLVANFPQTELALILQPAEPLQLPTRRDHDRWYIRHAQILRFLIIAIPGALTLVWLARLWHKALELQRWAATSERRMHRLRTSGKQPLFSPKDIRRLAVALRRRRPGKSTQLDAQLTVDRTCREAGYFTPIFSNRNWEPEYLFLGERKNLRDHQARLHDDLIDRLRDHDVSVQRYYFQSTPTSCSDAKGDVFALSELATLHPEHEFWLSLDAENCFDPVTATPERWWAQVMHWRYRVLLSFSRAKTDDDLRIIDPTRAGIEALIADGPEQSVPDIYPSILKEIREGWVSDLEPPPAAVARLLAQLRGYLGEQGYLLLQATAVYPEIAWNITEALAGALVSESEREETMNRLAALPWFRYGRMPDWLRVRLIQRLGARETYAREAVRRFLESSVDETRQRREALEIIARSPGKNARNSALLDHVYLAFASGHKLAGLSAQAPPAWRRFLRDSVWLRIGGTFVLMTLLWAVTTRTMNHLVHQSQNSPQTRSLDLRASDPFVAMLLQVAEAREGAGSSSDTGMTKVKSYSAISSDIMNVTDPLGTTLSASDLETLAHKHGPADLVSPGDIVVTERGPALVKAVEGTNLLTFSSRTWEPEAEKHEIFDIRGITSQSSTNLKGEQLAEWMDRHRNLTPEQQQQALSREPDFNQLPQATQERMRTRLAQLNAMPPEQRQWIVNYNTWMEHLSVDQRAQVRESLEQLGALPMDQRQQVAKSFRDLRELPTDQAAAMNSPQYRNMNPAQRSALNNLLRVEPLLPPAGQNLPWEDIRDADRKMATSATPVSTSAPAMSAPSDDPTMAISPDGSLFSTFKDLELSIWKRQTDQLMERFKGKIEAPIIGVRWSTDSRQISSYQMDGTSRTWDLASLRMTSLNSPDELTKSCEGGDALACDSVGERYANGLGVPADWVRAMTFFRMSCDFGDGLGCYMLGRSYKLGQGVAKDDSRALALFGKACTLNYREACYESNVIVGPIDNKKYLQQLLQVRYRAVITSGGQGSVSESRPEEHSVFAKALLQSLSEPHADVFTAAELFNSVQGLVAVQALVAGNSAQQLPTYESSGHSGALSGVFVFPNRYSRDRLGSGKYYGLLIGVERYKSAPNLNLRTSVADAESLAEVLKSYGFSIRLMTNPTRDEILSALNQYRATLEATDSLVIYFAGSAFSNGISSQCYWLPADATLESPSTFIPLSDVTNLAEEFPAQHVLTISDTSCAQGLKR